MPTSFRVPERGGGSYQILSILRWVMVLIFVAFGIQKFTPTPAHGIVQCFSNSPFGSWLSLGRERGEAYLLGLIEPGSAATLAEGTFSPLLLAIGALIGMATFMVTWSFFFKTPGVVKWCLSTDPVGWNLTGEFLFKNIVLLCVCVVLFFALLGRQASNSPPLG